MNALKESISVKAAEQAAAKAARLKKIAEQKEAKIAVEAGLTTVTRLQKPLSAKEQKLRKEGQPNLGISPEDIVLGKREVFDPAIGNRK